MIDCNNHNMYKERFYQFCVKLKYKKINIDFLHTYVDVAFSIQYCRAMFVLGRNYLSGQTTIDPQTPLFTTTSVLANPLKS